MIRMVMGAAAVSLLATACGAAGGGKSVLVAKCVKDGQDQKTCQCIADKTEKAVDPQVFRVLVLQAEEKFEEADKLMNSLPMEKQMTAFKAFSAIECLGQ